MAEKCGTTSRVFARGKRQPHLSQETGQSGEAASVVTRTSRGTSRALSRSTSTTSIQSESCLHTRPDSLACKTGTSGEPIELISNYFKLLTVTDWTLHQYHVTFEPEELRTHVRKRMLREHSAQLGPCLFDGTTLFSSINYSEVKTLESTDKAGVMFQIAIRFTREICRGQHEYLHFFNILIRKCLQGLKLQQVGRNYYDPHASVPIKEHNLELWPGYITSIRQHEDSILMCAEVTHKVMRVDTVLDVFNNIRRSRHSTLSDLCNEFKKAVLGIIVLTSYNNKTYKVDEVDFDSSPKSTFTSKNGTLLTYIEYYNKRYNITIKHMDQPLLISRSKPREVAGGAPQIVCLIPELCQMTGISDNMRTNFNLMRSLADHTRVTPNGRIEKLIAFRRRLDNVDSIKLDLQEWNLKVSKELVKIQGRVLKPEDIIFGGVGDACVRRSAGSNADWTQQLKGCRMLSSITVENWAVLCPQTIREIAQLFMKKVVGCAQSLGMVMGSPRYVKLENDKSASYTQAMETLTTTGLQDLIVCIVSNNRADRYDYIKKKSCGAGKLVPTQVITRQVMEKQNSISIANKIAIQINCKLGGCPWSVDIPLSNIMIIGFDVSYDTLQTGKSFGAIVATLDRSCSRYYSAVNETKHYTELANHFPYCLKAALLKYKNINKTLPSKIFMYRDGVGDGQLELVAKTEVALIKNLLNEVYGDDSWRLTFIVVTKRINTRLMTSKKNNPPPGTVVDDVVTLPDRYDFYLISQNVRQGTVSATSYNIISDNSGLTPDKIQRLTFKLTHLYFNWSGTVRVPAPVQYAHKLAQFASQHLHVTPAHQTTLYFL